MVDFGPGDRLRTVSTDSVCVIEEYLGEGMLGDVYRASVDGAIVAVRWYRDTHGLLDPERRQLLEDLIACGPPDDRFLWPLDIVVSDDRPGYGCLLPPRGPEFVEVAQVLSGEERLALLALAQAGFELADSFYHLHAETGASFPGFGVGSLAVDPGTGHIAIGGVPDDIVLGGREARVLGVWGFQAPEVVRGESGPSRATDLWALAVMLFYLFMLDHPLDGALEADVRIMDEVAERRLYGDHPVFVFDPVDTSNYPVSDREAGYQVNAIARWAILPTETRQLFVRAFTDGIRDPVNGRVQENEWRQAMVGLRDGWFMCGCGAENFHDELALQASTDHRPRVCWRCGGTPSLPPRLHITGAEQSAVTVVLRSGTKLYPHHLEADSMLDFSRVLAEVTPDPRSAGQVVLRNTSGGAWTVRCDDGTIAEVVAGQAVALTDGPQIVFGAKSGSIEYRESSSFSAGESTF